MIVILYKNGIEVKRGLASKIYPVRNMGVVDTLESGLEWKILVEGVKPTISEIENLVKNEVDNDTFHAVHTHLKQIDVVYTAERKSDAEINEIIKQAENSANENLINYTDRLKTMVLYMAIVHRKLNGNPINAKMQTILDKGDGYATKLWLNDTELKAKLQQVIDGQDTDINSNWNNG